MSVPASSLDPAFLATVQGRYADGATVAVVNGIPCWVVPFRPIVPRTVYRPGDAVAGGTVLLVQQGRLTVVLPDAPLTPAMLACPDAGIPPAIRALASPCEILPVFLRPRSVVGGERPLRGPERRALSRAARRALESRS